VLSGCRHFLQPKRRMPTGWFRKENNTTLKTDDKKYNLGSDLNETHTVCVQRFLLSSVEWWQRF
jgi:hypothetical protein